LVRANRTAVKLLPWLILKSLEAYMCFTPNVGPARRPRIQHLAQTLHRAGANTLQMKNRLQPAVVCGHAFRLNGYRVSSRWRAGSRRPSGLFGFHGGGQLHDKFG
jgi:hypothetical protein